MDEWIYMIGEFIYSKGCGCCAEVIMVQAAQKDDLLKLKVNLERQLQLVNKMINGRIENECFKFEN